MLSDELAQMVANSCPIPITGFAIVRMWWELSSFVLGVAVRLNGTDKRSDLLDRADADSIGFSQCAINGPRFRDPHLGAMDYGRDVKGVGVTVSRKPLAHARFEDSGLKCITTIFRIRKLPYRTHSNARAASSLRYVQE